MAIAPSFSWLASSWLTCSRTLIAALIITASGCAPRGESKSLDEVLALARERFSAVQKSVPANAMAGEASKSLDQAMKAIEGIVAASSLGEQATQAKSVEAAFSELLPNAGYTSRAALAEVQKQYGQIANQVSAEAAGLPPAADQVAKVKLAAARAYTILASELETTGFNLSSSQK